LREVVQLAWDRFKIISTVIGDVQGRIMATLFYFTALLPFGIVSRLFTDPLSLRRTPAAWVDRPTSPETLDSARRQG
jgi:hypothetical protein